MPGSTETEIKLAASAAMLRSLRDHPALAGVESTRALHSTWFDTPSRALAAGGASLRVREAEGGAPEQTFKLEAPATAGLHRREWTIAHERDQPVGTGFPRSAQARLRRLVGAGQLRPYAVVEVERTVRLVQWGRSTIEVAFDTGAIRAGERHLDLCEVELELVKGRPADLFALAAALPLGPDLRWSTASKAGRSQILAFDLTPEAQRAAAPELRANMTVRAGFQAIGWSCLGPLIANSDMILATGEPEAIHQARVAVRRLRVAFKALRSIVSDAVAPVLGAELKAVGQQLGAVRDVDVLISLVRSTRPVSEAASADLMRELATRRAAVLGEARAALASASFQQLLVAIAAWLEAGKWRGAAEAQGPLTEWSAQILTRGRKSLRQRSAALDQLSNHALHRVRKDAKALRYYAGFHASLYRGPASESLFRGFVASLAAAQEALGKLQDAVAVRRFAETAFAAAEPIVAARVREELRQLLGERERKGRKELKAARKSFRQAWDNGKWWRAGEVEQCTEKAVNKRLRTNRCQARS